MTVALALAGATPLVSAGRVPSDPPALLWREAPDFLRLFAPAGARSAVYRTFVSGADLDTILAAVQRDSALVRTPGAWQPRAVLPGDAFGQSGRYLRWTVARLYGAERARVARGARRADGRIAESWTLISPYPDPGLRHLECGTLLILVRLP